MASMTKQEILKTIQNLSRSQGFYCRVLEAVNENPKILDKLEKREFGDAVDLVMYLEC